MKLHLASVGCISPFGSDLGEIAAARREKTLANQEKLSFQIAGAPKSICVERSLDPKVKLQVPDSVLRRMSRSTKLVLSSVEEAKIRSQLNWELESQKRIGILVGTNNGPAQTNLDYIQRLLEYDFAGASPNLFAQSVPNNIASSIAMSNKWKGPTLTLIHREHLWQSLVRVAETWIKHDKVDLLWIILGNEVSLQGSYATLYDATQKEPALKELDIEGPAKPTEAYTSFLITKKAPENSDFSLEDSTELLERFSKKTGYLPERPEEVGPLIAEHYFKTIFPNGKPLEIS